MNTTNSRRGADNIRILTAAMVEKAKSGHPGGAMGGADFVDVLYSQFLITDPDNPTWFARDRFFLDPGHMSPMLYSVLALTGKYTMEELQQFRQWGTVCPGHPELNVARGIENTSGPLGQGHTMAVGCAIAERFLQARFGDVVAHKTYAFISDGGIQEEISQGAGRIAGYLGLSNLIMFFDSNRVQLSTNVDAVDEEDYAAKYRAWGWNVLEVDGTDHCAMAAALTLAQKETKRPTIIIGRTIMGMGCVTADGENFEGQLSTHGQPLSKAGVDVARTIKGLGGDPEKPFQIWDDVKAKYEARNEELRAIVAKRYAEYDKWAKENPEKAALLQQYLSGKAPEIDWAAIQQKAGQATRGASSTVLGVLGEQVGNMIVSSADLCNSDKTDGFLKKTHAFTNGDFTGAFLQAGVSELSMACIMNGIALHGGLWAACGTFFVFSDYMKPAIRMAALMELPVKYVWSHDAFRVGEDGPTHQPVEQEAQIRLMEQLRNHKGNPSMLVLRPADAAETTVCWQMAMENVTTPTALILSRQNLTDLPSATNPDSTHTRSYAEALDAARGAYIVVDSAEPKVVMVANGSEVSLLCEVAKALEVKGVQSRVISMPSFTRFFSQEASYQEALFPAGVPVFCLTAGLPVAFEGLLYNVSKHVQLGATEIYSMNHFGYSAPYKVLDEKFGFVLPAVLPAVEALIKK